jgi:hypothetical protein
MENECPDLMNKHPELQIYREALGRLDTVIARWPGNQAMIFVNHSGVAPAQFVAATLRKLQKELETKPELASFYDLQSLGRAADILDAL